LTLLISGDLILGTLLCVTKGKFEWYYGLSLNGERANISRKTHADELYMCVIKEQT